MPNLLVKMSTQMREHEPRIAAQKVEIEEG